MIIGFLKEGYGVTINDWSTEVDVIVMSDQNDCRRSVAKDDNGNVIPGSISNAMYSIYKEVFLGEEK